MMSFEPAEDQSPVGTPYLDRTENSPDAVFVHPAVLPNGQRIRLLKTLLTSACERDCFYCPFRAGRDIRRTTFRPEEFARLFVMLANKGIAEGVFLKNRYNAAERLAQVSPEAMPQIRYSCCDLL